VVCDAHEHHHSKRNLLTQVIYPYFSLRHNIIPRPHHLRALAIPYRWYLVVVVTVAVVVTGGGLLAGDFAQVQMLAGQAGLHCSISHNRGMAAITPTNTHTPATIPHVTENTKISIAVCILFPLSVWFVELLGQLFHVRRQFLDCAHLQQWCAATGLHDSFALLFVAHQNRQEAHASLLRLIVRIRHAN